MQSPREADLKREAPQAEGESKQISQHLEASASPQADSALAVQTKRSAHDGDFPKRNYRRAKRKVEQEEASDNELVPQIRRYEAKVKTECGGAIVWIDKRKNHAHRPGTLGYGQRPGWFECR